MRKVSQMRDDLILKERRAAEGPIAEAEMAEPEEEVIIPEAPMEENDPTAAE